MSTGKHLLASAVIAYAVICITTRVAMLKSLAGFQPNS